VSPRQGRALRRAEQRRDLTSDGLTARTTSAYKQQLFDLLSEHYAQSIEAGEMEVVQEIA
jgi:hypothetical protein